MIEIRVEIRINVENTHCFIMENYFKRSERSVLMMEREIKKIERKEDSTI
jgi:hypothetical protein